MKIELGKILTSPQQIRKTWTEEGIKELAQSIDEQGLIVPIKVRPNERGYKLIYGHRRVEAMRLLGMEETDAIVEGMDDFNALLQQATENESREDVPYQEKAEGYEALLKHPNAPEDFSQRRLAKAIGIGKTSISRAMAWLEEHREGSAVVRADHWREGAEGVMQTGEIRAALGDDTALKKKVAAKVSEEGLTRKQTRTLAELAKGAQEFGGKKAVKRLLNTPYEKIGAYLDPQPAPQRLPPVKKKKKPALFQFVRQFQVIATDAAWQDIGTGIAFAEYQGFKDLGGARETLKRWRGYAEQMIVRIDDTLEKLNG